MLSLKAFLGLDGSGFEMGIKRAQSTAKKFSSSIGSDFKSKIGALFTVAAAEEGVRKILEYTGHINDLSDELGMSTDAIQQWDYALRLAGSDIDKAAGFFEHLAESRDKALGGDANAMDAFGKLGVSPSDLRNKRLEDLGAQIGNTIKAGDAQKLIGALKEVGGRGAASMMAAFKAGIAESLADAPLIKEKDIIDLDALGDKFTSLGKTLLATFAPVLATIARVIGADIDRRILTLRELAAFATTLAKTGSLGEAYKAAITETQKFLDEEGKKQAAKNKPGAGGGATPKDKNYDPVLQAQADELQRLLSLKGQSSSSMNINDMQRAGGLIRYNDPIRSELARNTEATRNNTDAIKKLLLPGNRPPSADGTSEAMRGYHEY